MPSEKRAYGGVNVTTVPSNSTKYDAILSKQQYYNGLYSILYKLQEKKQRPLKCGPPKDKTVW